MAASRTDGRVRLDPEAIIDAVLDLARDEPSVEITVRRLGDVLGVSSTAVYRHFRDMDEVFRAAVDRLYGRIVGQLPDPSTFWRERLEQYAEQLLRDFLEVPPLAQLAPLVDGRGVGELASIDYVLTAMSDSGLEDAEAVRAYAAYAGYILAFAAGAARERMRSAGSAERSPWIKGFDVIELQRFPRVERSRADLFGLDVDAVYRVGVAAVLDAVESRSAPRGAS